MVYTDRICRNMCRDQLGHRVHFLPLRPAYCPAGHVYVSRVLRRDQLLMHISSVSPRSESFGFDSAFFRAAAVKETAAANKTAGLFAGNGNLLLSFLYLPHLDYHAG